MDQVIMVAMLGYIDALDRSADINERFADHLAALVRVTEADPQRADVSAAMLDLAHRHRVDAIKGRARAEAASQTFIECFGVDRLKRIR